MDAKVCTGCNERKPLTEFHKNKRVSDGYQSRCKVCAKKYHQENKDRINERNKQYYQENKDRIKQYQQENKDKIKEYRKQYRQENKDRIKEYDKQYYQESKDRQKERSKQYYQENKNRIREYYKQYRQENKDKIKQYRQENKDGAREYHKQYNKQKCQTDPLFALRRNIRTRCWKALKGSKSKKTTDMLGCSFEQLYFHLHLERFENPSHDHIIPLSWGETVEEIEILAHYTNLQGMELEKNISKGNHRCSVAKAHKVLKQHPNPDAIKTILSRKTINNGYYENN